MPYCFDSGFDVDFDTSLFFVLVSIIQMRASFVWVSAKDVSKLRLTTKKHSILLVLFLPLYRLFSSCQNSWVFFFLIPNALLADDRKDLIMLKSLVWKGLDLAPTGLRGGLGLVPSEIQCVMIC